MFHVGRYDPREEEERKEQKQKLNKEGRKCGRKHARQRDFSSSPTKQETEHKSNVETKRPRTESHERFQEDTNDSINLSSGSVEQSKNVRLEESGSSSSVPSSTDDDEESEAKDRKPIRIIAPEQKPVPSIPKHCDTTVEAYDDFDIEDDQMVEPDVSAGGNEDSGRVWDSQASKEITAALHMSSLPIKDAAEAWDLAPFLVKNLQRDGYEHFFPIQSLVIPDVSSSERHSHIRARDVCVAAPTGSGKTLAFVLPVLNSLSKRKVRRLRALVVLPSRDLATQVFEVFERYTNGSDLRVGLAIGQSDFLAEQEAITVGSRRPCHIGDVEVARHRYLFHRGSVEHALEAFSGISDTGAPSLDGSLSSPAGGKSALDVLVATPGRLVDHLDKTPGFTLQHLRFLIIDEADRLVNQSYHNWIGRVIDAANSASVSAWNEMERTKVDGSQPPAPRLKVSPDGNSFVIDPITWRRGGAGGDSSSFNTNDGYSSVVASVCRPVQLRKILYSATLTKDPQKLASLCLVNAKHFDAHVLNTESQFSERRGRQRYSMPPGLSEHTVECTAEQKPLVLLALLLEYTSERGIRSGSQGIAVVFTSSLDSTHRLVRLLQLLWAAVNLGPPQSIAEFSSALNQKQRSSLMKRCNASDRDVSVVVCSDGMSRGMDLPSVSVVINYDVPSFAKTYVHRCGRTARAGREGAAISVLKGGQVVQFQRMRSLIDFPDRVSPLGIRKDLVRKAMPVYGSCITSLRNVIEAEKDGELDALAVLPSTWIPSL